MRQQRTQRSMPAPAPKPRSDVPESGYALIVDAQAKADFKTHKHAMKVAEDLKRRFQQRITACCGSLSARASLTIRPSVAYHGWCLGYVSGNGDADRADHHFIAGTL